MTQQTRRSFIKGMFTTSAAVSLGGCGLLDLSSFDPARFNLPCNGSSPIVTDAHAHFFNASDLNFARYLSGPVLNDAINNGDSLEYQVLLNATADLIQAIGNIVACSARAELFWLRQPSPKMSLAAAQSEKQKMLQDEVRTVADDLFQFMPTNNTTHTNDKEKAFVNFRNAYEQWQTHELTKYQIRAGQTFSVQNYVIPFEYDVFLALSNDMLPNIEISTALDDPLQQDIELINSKARGYLELIRAIFSPRSTNIQKYMDRYSKAPGPTVHNVMAVTCDFDYWLGPKAYSSSHSTQIKLYSKLSELTHNFVIPVLGVNPYKMVNNKKYQNMVSDALTNKGFKGVKLYPTLGYAMDGSEVELQFNPQNYDERDISRGLDNLYSITGSEYFIMSHAMQSKGVSANARKFSNANYWKKVLTNNKDLRINFGHLGGFNGNNRTNYLKLMNQYENVYGDLGYQPTLSDTLYAKILVNSMRNISDELFNKVMFGSDWFMLLQERTSKDYLSGIYDSFEQLVTQNFLKSGERDNLFRHNAMRMANVNKSC